MMYGAAEPGRSIKAVMGANQALDSPAHNKALPPPCILLAVSKDSPAASPVRPLKSITSWSAEVQVKGVDLREEV